MNRSILSIVLGVIVGFNGLQADVTVRSYCSDEFKNKSASEIIKQNLSEISASPNLVVWGIGAQGLTDRSLDFYEEQVFIPLRDTFSGLGKCYFYDLSTWDVGSWRSKRGEPSATFSRKYAGSASLESFLGGEGYSVEVLFGSGLFTEWMPTLTTEAFGYVKETVLSDDFVWEKSRGRTPKGTFVKRTFLGSPISIFRDMGEMRIDFLYSAVQYVEAIFLVNELISKGVMDITLLLPNDEFDYYIGADDSHFEAFQKDLNMVLLLNTEGDIGDITLNLVPFKYGRRVSDRPYTFKKFTDSKVSWG